MTYRILSLDGGGTWSVLQVMALIDLYGADRPGTQVLEQFHMVAATASGSLVLGGLLANLRLDEIKALFVDPKQRGALLRSSGWFNTARYNTRRKHKAIEKFLGDVGEWSLDKIKKRSEGADFKPLEVLITAYDYDDGHPVVFRSSLPDGRYQHPSTVVTPEITLSEAIHASTTPPIRYFDRPARVDSLQRRYWGGAVSGYNNPAVIAVQDALARGVPREKIAVLSLGTGTVLPDLSKPLNYKKTKRGVSQPLHDEGVLLNALLDNPRPQSCFLAENLIAPGNIVRLNPLLALRPDGQGGWVRPGSLDINQFQYLRELQLDAHDPVAVQAITGFGRLWLEGAVRNEPVLLDEGSQACLIGHDDIRDAKASWDEVRKGRPALQVRPVKKLGLFARINRWVDNNA